jgi:hypothetical protein
MEEDNLSGQSGEGLRCSWCGAQLSNDETGNNGQSVCRRCVRLLMDAGLADEAIFDDDDGARE